MTERLQTLKVRLDESWRADMVVKLVVPGPPTSTREKSEPTDEGAAKKESMTERKENPDAEDEKDKEKAIGPHERAGHCCSGGANQYASAEEVTPCVFIRDQ